MSKLKPLDVAPLASGADAPQQWARRLRELPPAQELPRWFASVALGLMQHTSLVVAGVPYDLLELEFYLRSPAHPDPFAHAHPDQASCAGWYVHRKGQSFSNGTYKGLDLTFGPADAYAGVLIRTLGAPHGGRVNGCSLCVDAIMEGLGLEHVSQLGACWLPSGAFDTQAPVHLALRQRPARATIWPTSRVGLTLKRQATHPQMPAFIGRPYRMVSALDVPKGRVHTAVAMLKRGLPEAHVARAVSTTRAHAARLGRAYTEGKDHSPHGFADQRLDAAGLARLQGACDATFGDPFFTLLQENHTPAQPE